MKDRQIGRERGGRERGTDWVTDGQVGRERQTGRWIGRKADRQRLTDRLKKDRC